MKQTVGSYITTLFILYFKYTVLLVHLRYLNFVKIKRKCCHPPNPIYSHLVPFPGDSKYIQFSGHIPKNILFSKSIYAFYN